MRILLIRLGAFGDIVHTLPLLRDLAASGHEIHWLVEDRWASLLCGHPDLAAIHQLPRKRWKTASASLSQKMADMRQLRRSLRRASFDAVIDAQGLAKSALWTRCIGVGIRLGFAQQRAREGAWLLYNRWLRCSNDINIIHQQRLLAASLRTPMLTTEAQAHFPTWHTQQQAMDTWLHGQHLSNPIALNVGAGWPSKQWPQQLQADWLQQQEALGERVLIIWGGPQEEALAKALCAGTSHVMAPNTDLPQLACLLRRCRILISGDTGPLHLAAALGTPTVGLFGPVPASRNGPVGPAHENIQAAGKAWERKDPKLGGMTLITASMVNAAMAASLAATSRMSRP